MNVFGKDRLTRLALLSEVDIEVDLEIVIYCFLNEK